MKFTYGDDVIVNDEKFYIDTLGYVVGYDEGNETRLQVKLQYGDIIYIEDKYLRLNK